MSAAMKTPEEEAAARLDDDGGNLEAESKREEVERVADASRERAAGDCGELED